jgi:hypothetical protein
MLKDICADAATLQSWAPLLVPCCARPAAVALAASFHHHLWKWPHRGAAIAAPQKSLLPGTLQIYSTAMAIRLYCYALVIVNMIICYKVIPL